ncbi:hypothetical protein LZ31DRAFT_571641 [Colletotrichum somersetense]|nr:hypothetical protein LZ31DRAFT_571641 [Colletotrichum somersetense]
MRHLRLFHIHLLLVACLVTVAQADGWDDFANNLATDLAPILSLFGEQVTKQFLSESTTMWDNFIFAMAPLGVITAVVSAIRVCGGSSLRAFIGRAQEGGGIAEAELCSSTSRDVCELYHNGAIVRVFGRPKILEVIYDPKAAEKEFTGRSAPSNDEQNLQMQKINSHNSNGSSNFAPNPNLSFNIGIRRQPEYVTWLAAAFAFFAQASVLVFGGLVTMWGWEKEENVPPAWAFPLMLLGTVLLCFGMFCCSYLVESSTEERVFRRSNNTGDSKKAKTQNSGSIYVVQPGNQTIGDQTFDSFLFNDSETPINKYVTSWKIPEQPGKELGVWLAIATTMTGFILQFVGLRAMHSAVSVLQLGAILLVSIIRAGLRTQRLRKESNRLRECPDEIEGHELDWLALHMGRVTNHESALRTATKTRIS